LKLIFGKVLIFTKKVNEFWQNSFYYVLVIKEVDEDKGFVQPDYYSHRILYLQEIS